MDIDIEDESPPLASSNDMSFPSPSRAPLPPLIPPSSEQLQAYDYIQIEPSPKRFKSSLWEHFKKLSRTDENVQEAMCLYCDLKYQVAPSNNTLNLSNHLEWCKKYPPNNDKVENVQAFQNSPISVGEGTSRVEGRVGNLAITHEEFRRELVKMIIIDGLPFRFVEGKGFRRYMEVVQPFAIIPSRTIIVRYVFDIFMEEKKKLRLFLKNCSARVCLTVDIQSSCQDIGYMLLTAHFIDKNWKLCKKNINFCPIADESGEVIGKSVERCLLDWDIDQVLAVTVDTASSYDKFINYLREQVIGQNGTVLNGHFLHVRCLSHMFGLIVKERLQESHEHILRIRHAVRYVKCSPARWNKFKMCVEEEKIESNKILYLDVETRWNTTYLMLEAACELRKAFDLLKRVEKYRDEMNELEGMPSDDDWDHVGVLLPFLETFYEATLRMCGSLYVTGNMYLQEIVGVLNMFRLARDSDDSSISGMALDLKKKYDKYWGDARNTNTLLFIAVVLDPTKKMRYVEWALKEFFDFEVACDLRAMVHETLKKLFEFYASRHTCSFIPQPSSSVKAHELISGSPLVKNSRQVAEQQFEDYVRAEESSSGVKKNDLEKYLEDRLYVVPTGKTFDVLDWWKKNAQSFEVLALMAKDVLALPISTVTSASAFDTDNKLLDPFRSSLTARMSEALICCQDWLRSSRKPLQVEERMEDVESIEADLEGLPPMLHIDESDSAEE